MKEQHLKLIEAEPLILKRFSNVERISQDGGDGHFSLVFKARDEKTNGKVILKFYNPLQIGDLYRYSCFKRESDLLQKLKGEKDILQLVEPFSELKIIFKNPANNLEITSIYPFFATEYGTSNVMKYIYSDDNVASKNLQLFRTMCRAVQRIHNLCICHRDIKPDNFFFLDKATICLGDFGTARCLDGSEPPLSQNYYGWRGDKRYTAPEQCVNMKEDISRFYKGDMYSLGAILFELFTKRPLFTLIFDTDFHDRLSEAFGNIPEDQRTQIFGQLIPDVAKDRQLPNIYDLENNLPSSIRTRINGLFKKLSNLDYRKRNISFTDVFSEINTAELILKNEEKYKRWIAFRRKMHGDGDK
jgi:serine/threonine protein kinase